MVTQTLRLGLEASFASAGRDHLGGKMDFSQRSSHLHAVLSQNRPYVASLTHKVRMSCVVGLCHLFTRSTMFSDPKISYVAVKYF